LPEYLKKRDQSEELGENGRVGNRLGRCGLDSSESEYRRAVGFCEHCNETSGSKKGG